MQKNYIIGGAVILIIASALFFTRSSPIAETGSTLTSAISFSHSHSIAVDIADAKKVYIATHEGLYLLQNDKDLFQVGKSRDDLMGFSPHPTISNIFFSSGHPARGGNIGFQKTTDGGVSWEKISTGLGGTVDFHSMTVSQVNPDLVYGFFGNKLQRSTDGGRSWEYAKGTIAPISLSSDIVKENVLYASTRSGVQVSEDKGDTWKSISPQLEGGAVSVFAVDPQTPAHTLAFSEKLGGMGKSVDGGVMWQKLPETFGGEAVLYLSFSKSEMSTVYVLTSANSIYKSTNSGDSWTKVR